MPNESGAHSKKIADLLKREGLLSAEQLQAVLKLATDEDTRIEEAVLELELATEADLLRVLANFYKTQFVSTEKLSKVNIDARALAMIPKAVADAYAIFPVVFDPKTQTLSVVTANPDDVQTLREVQAASGVAHVKAFVARPRAVKAAIARAHHGDMQAFARLEMVSQVQQHGMRNMKALSTRPPPPPEELVRRPTAGGANLRAPAPPRTASSNRLSSILPPAAQDKTAAYSAEELLELLNVLISLLENSRPDLRGHSAHVARLCRRVAERMALPLESIVGLAAAGFVHDLGKMGTFHLTALNCSEYDGHKTAAQKSLSTPVRLLEAVKLRKDTTDAVEHMYERYDGNGFPDGLSGKEIPFGARILSIVDTYADLTQNPRNPYRKTLTPTEAFTVLTGLQGTVFDPDLVAVFNSVVMGEDVKARLLANRYVALLVDGDAEETTVLELRLIEQGFEVKSARTVEQAKKILAEGNIDIVVSEVDLPPGDGLALLAEARAEAWGKDVAWVMHTRRQGRVEAQRAFNLGIVDFVSKPAPSDVLVAKLKAHLDGRRKAAPVGTAGGVSGSLREMGLPDMVQVLFHGRKSGNLKIRRGNDAGEIHFVKGAVVNAIWGGLKGADAFYKLLLLDEGDFQLDPGFKPQETLIHESAESLLLEGMRRMDEGV